MWLSNLLHYLTLINKFTKEISHLITYSELRFARESVITVFRNPTKCEEVMCILQRSPHHRSILTSKMLQCPSELVLLIHGI